ncbi:MAG: flagellar export chaperone FlgN [Phycisphaerales bacterium]
MSADPTQALEPLLADLVAAHEHLLALAGEQRAALSRADARAAEDAARRQADAARHIAHLDAERRRLVAQIAPGAALPTLTSLAARFPEPLRARIAAIAARLRELLARIQEEQRILRAATSALIAHMDGLMQQVARALTNPGVYGPRGRTDATPAPPCGLDLTT